MTKLFSTRVLSAVVITVAITAVALLLWKLSNVLLLGFAGLLVAVFLQACANAVCRLTQLPEGWALAVILLVLLALSGLASWLLLPRIVGQLGQLANSLPTLLAQLEAQAEAVPALQSLTQQIPPLGTLMAPIVTNLSNTLMITVSALTNVFLVFVIGAFLAASPKLHRYDLIRLVPVAARKRARELMAKLGATLRTWLLGELLAVLLVAVCTTLGLWSVGVPYALVLGITAGLLDFIPYLGPVLATVPGALIALTSGGIGLAVWAILVYLTVQQLENNLFQPVIQREAAQVPPVVLLLALAMFGQLFGLLGLVVATPLVAVSLVLAKELYVGWLEAPSPITQAFLLPKRAHHRR